jgi:hypothetical protein
MAWCSKCHYGSETCKIVKCPQCGSVELQTVSPFGSNKGKAEMKERILRESKTFEYDAPELKIKSPNWANHGILNTK